MDNITQVLENITQAVENITEQEVEVIEVIEESESSFFSTLLKIIVAIIIILLISCCGLSTAVPSEEKERQIRFSYLTGKRQYAKKNERVKSEVQIFDDSNSLVVPGGHLDVVYVGPDGAVRPASAVHSSTNSLLVSFEAPQDGDYTIRVYYDGVLVNDDRSYPFAGLVNKEAPTKAAEGEKSDEASRVPVPTEETTRELPLPEPEPTPAPAPVPEPVELPPAPKPEPVPEPEPEPEPEAPEPLQDSSEEEKTSETSDEEKEVKEEGTPKKPKKGGFFKGLFHSDKGPGSGAAKQGGLQVHVDYPQKMVMMDRDVLIMVRLEDLDKREFVDEPNVKIFADIEGPKKKKFKLDAEKVDEVGSWKIIFHPPEAGKYKSKVFVNNQDAQKKWSTINVGSTMQSVAENLPIPTLHMGKKKDKHT